jgi:hypothetical protein
MRILYTACLAAGALAGGSVAVLFLHEPLSGLLFGVFTAGALWGQFAGFAVSVFAEKHAELRGRPARPLRAAAWAAGFAGAVSWLTGLGLLGLVSAAC